MKTIILIGIGGLTGAILRYTVSGWAQNAHHRFPAGTLTVNIIGSLLLGLIMYLSEYSSNMRARAEDFSYHRDVGRFHDNEYLQL
jgi:CrcB protein